MTSPQNDRYQRRFTDPKTRPSNRRVDRLVEHTRWQVEQLARWLDQDAGPQVPPGYDPVLEAQRHTGQIRRGDPGE